ncbi:hypothetical protein DDQ68_03825 [Hymenobacter nivis]|uniref:Uncharacterized protein n=1 Tax=Hymenobacter nivis TaxID=1850093 RepID=A0A2Z3GGH4_9BACT|nr:hypothetical protein DDQ68_03825 [Hymenobacter nivis]
MYEPVESAIGPALTASFESDLQQGAVGRLDGPATTEQPALAELVVAHAGPVGGQVGAELGGHRGGQAGQPGHGLFHGRALSGPEAGASAAWAAAAWAAAASVSATW